MTHGCPGPGCGKEVGSSMLMCLRVLVPGPQSRSARPCGVPGGVAPVRILLHTGRPVRSDRGGEPCLIPTPP
jgi:hypothetical protein